MCKFFILNLLKNFFTNRPSEKPFPCLQPGKGASKPLLCWRCRCTGSQVYWRCFCIHGPSLAMMDCRASIRLTSCMSTRVSAMLLPFLQYLLTGVLSYSSLSHSHFFFNIKLFITIFCPSLDLTLRHLRCHISPWVDSLNYTHPSYTFYLEIHRRSRSSFDWNSPNRVEVIFLMCIFIGDLDCITLLSNVHVLWLIDSE
jgi:hypothetical protein